MSLPSTWMWELDHKEGWIPKNWYFQIVVLEKTLESPLDSKEIKPINPKGNQPWIFIGRTDAEAEALILWPPDAKSPLIGKDLDPGKDWGQEEKGATEDEMVGWHHRLSGHEFKQAPGVGNGQWSLACSSPWGHKESDMTERLIWYDLIWFAIPWTATCRASLSFTVSWSLLKLVFIESMIPSNHLFLCHPLLLLLSIFPRIKVFSNKSAFGIRWLK